MATIEPPIQTNSQALSRPVSSRTSLSGITLCDSEANSPVYSEIPRPDSHVKQNLHGQKGQSPQQKKDLKSQQQKDQKSQSKKQKQSAKIEKPFHQSLGEDLLQSIQPQPNTSSNTTLPLPPVSCEEPLSQTSFSDDLKCLSRSSLDLNFFLEVTPPASVSSSSRKSSEFEVIGATKIIRDVLDPSLKYRNNGSVYSLADLRHLSETEKLILDFGRVTHMGIRDHSYEFWMNHARTALIHFKVLNKVAVLGGDPICSPEIMPTALKEFHRFCRKVKWKIAIIGGSAHTAELAKQRGWTCMRFGTEQVLNPQTNEVLLGKAGKRIVTQCKQLLDSARGGISIRTYVPAQGRNAELESSLKKLYEEWREERNATRDSQAFVTVFELFAMPKLMTFLYTTDKSGNINGFAALRKLGAPNGYHIDPFIQSASAPRGVSDLLIFASLALLNVQGCSYLSLGYEPVAELDEIWGLPTVLRASTKSVYKHVFGKLPIAGKEAFHARWKPDEAQQAPLYLIFVGKIPNPRYLLAMMHFANISLRRIIASDWQALITKQNNKDKCETANKTTTAGEAMPESGCDKPQLKEPVSPTTHAQIRSESIIRKIIPKSLFKLRLSA